MIRRSEIRGDVEVPNYRLEMTRGNVAYRGPEYYNNISAEHRAIDSNKAFTRKLYKAATDSIGVG